MVRVAMVAGLVRRLLEQVWSAEEAVPLDHAGHTAGDSS